MIRIDLESSTPIYQQIVDQIVLAIAKEELQPQEDLPSVRLLAEMCDINPMTVNKAYAILKRDGYLEIDRKGTKVAAKKIREEKRVQQLQEELALVVSKLKLENMSKAEMEKLFQRTMEGFLKREHVGFFGNFS